MKPSLIDMPSIVFGIAACIVCFIIINAESGMPINSFIAALMAGALAWLSYVVIRMIYLSIKRP